MIKKPLLTLILLGAIFFLTGCAQKTKFHIYVDSIGESSKSKMNYILLSGNKKVNVDDLEFKEYATYINRALKKKGFIQSSFENANIAIFLDYGIGEPKENSYSYSLPTYGKTGVSSSTTYGTVNTYGNSASYSGTTYNTPSYGITGSQSYSGTHTTYHRYAILSATDLAKYKINNKTIQLWKTTISSTGSSGDLRRVFPLLITASQNYLGTNSTQKIKILLSEDDKEVLEIKGVKEK